MSDDQKPVDWSKTTFEGSRREQLNRAQRMTVRQRLQALEELTELSERLQAMRRGAGASGASAGVREPRASYRAEALRNDIVLEGCTPTPLANYLKALGVLRLLSARDPQARGSWRDERFVLRTALDRAAVERFFLQEYEPTPIMAPWNGGSGFYYQERKSKEIDPLTLKKKKLGIYNQETTATKVLSTVLASKSKRLEAYRNALHQAKLAVEEAGFATSPDSGRQKDEFILSLRASLPDVCIQAIDAGLAVTRERTRYPPVLGTGWNDGNLDFTSNFMQRLLDVLGTDDSAPDCSIDWLRASLFGASSPNLTKSAIGQFSPSQAGGPNATVGFRLEESTTNPWDFVLMIEGALSLAATAVRRNADDSRGALGYPFTVRAVGAGSGSLGEADAINARGELWIPLWPQPSTYAEIRALMSEGRVALGKKTARDALDFVRAVQQLGGYRGIDRFQRYGFLMRSGRSYLATPLARVEVSNIPQSRWLDDLDSSEWLDRFRQFACGDKIALRFRQLRKNLEDSLFALAAREPSKAEAQSLLILLGRVQRALSTSPRARDTVPPIPMLSDRWVAAADDGTPAFRIAKALAGLRGAGEEPLPLCAQLFPMQRNARRWIVPEGGEKVRIYSGQRGRLTETLSMLLKHRLWLTEKLKMSDKPLASAAGAILEDVNVFLRDDAMDERISALLPGLSLCAISREVEHKEPERRVPASFALLKLLFTPDRTLRSLGLLSDDTFLPVPADILGQLAAGNHENRAIRSAWRRLRALRLAPVVALDALPGEDSISPRRASAALLIPLRYAATAALAREVLATELGADAA